LTCGVCGAPALPVGGACAFCRSPLTDQAPDAEVVSYLGRVVPGARAARSGLFGRGRVSRLEVDTSNGRFRARARRSGWRFEPEGDLAGWTDGLVKALSRRASGEPELRAALSRAGWRLR
jgi:hypothetical protein